MDRHDQRGGGRPRIGDRLCGVLEPRPSAQSEEADQKADDGDPAGCGDRSEEHTSELQSLMRISYAVFCLKKKTQYKYNTHQTTTTTTKSTSQRSPYLTTDSN